MNDDSKKEMRSKIGKRNRRKGADFERMVARMLNQLLPSGYVARRRLQARGGFHEPDVCIYRAHDPMPLCHVECKTGKKPNLGAAIAQATAQSYRGIPVFIAIKKTFGNPEFFIVGGPEPKPVSAEEIVNASIPQGGSNVPIPEI